MVRQQKSGLCVSLAEAQAYARVETGEEEAVLVGLLRVASELCEEFIGQALLVRGFEQELVAPSGWAMLSVQPVRSITSVTMVGAAEPLPAGSYRADIDHDGRGFVNGIREGSRCLVSGLVGMAEDANEVPEPIRQGILRLAAHLFVNRDGPAGELPKGVTALWRPFRRAGLGR